jgi:putative transcriptional regulator
VAIPGLKMPRPSVSLLKSGKVRGVRFDTLSKICEVLNCQPGGLLEYRAEGGNAEKAMESYG